MQEETPKNKQKSDIPWDKAVGGDYLKWEQDEKKVILIVDWTLVEKEVPVFNKPDDKETKYVFTAKVLSVDGKESPDAKLEQMSKPFMVAMRKVLEKKDASVPVKLRIKRLGDGKNTTYDAEVEE